MRLYILILAFLLPTVVSAYDYTMLEPLPFISGTNVSFPALMEGFFKLCMVLGAVLAVLMITLGGIQYMTSDVLEQKGAGRERIKNAVFGLLLLLAIWVILYTINPALLNFKLQLGGVGSTGTQPGLQTTPVSGNPGTPINPGVTTVLPPNSTPPADTVSYSCPSANVVVLDKAAKNCQKLLNNATSLGCSVVGSASCNCQNPNPAQCP